MGQYRERSSCAPSTGPAWTVWSAPGRGHRVRAIPVLRRPVVRRALKFAAVGTAGLVVNTAALYMLHGWARLPVPLASALAVELAIGHNYLLNDWWTFAVRRPSLQRFAKFNASALGGLGVNVLTVWALIGFGTYLLVANALAVAVGFAVNFAFSARWVWARRSR